jgi:hypothetical protein
MILEHDDYHGIMSLPHEGDWGSTLLETSSLHQ